MDTSIFKNNDLLENIKEECSQKKVIRLCDKLIKKCSYKNMSNCETMCHLAYWLYIYDRPEIALDLIKATHDIEFFCNWNVWTFIHHMWGLEIRILRERGDKSGAVKVANIINEQHLCPSPMFDTPEKIAKHEKIRRANFTYEDVIEQKKIRQCVEDGDKTGANSWKFIALLGMIEYAETGFYPKLNERKEEIEQKINEYIAELKKTK